MRIPALVLAATATLLCAPAAQAYEAINKLQVVPLSGGDFEVIEARGEGPRGIWCAAADYALHAGQTPRETRLYVKSPRGASLSGAGRTGVAFTTDAARLGRDPVTSFSVSVRVAGLGLPVHHAHQFCKDYLIEPEDISFDQKWRF